MKDIIFAKATADGFSVINVIKVSGKNSHIFVNPLIKKKLKHQQMTYTDLFDLNQEYMEKILVVYFKAPNSFTGEDIVEFHLHGNEYLINKVIKNLIILGAKIAKPGEFLERRYSNGKISLIECEMINNKIIYGNKDMFKLTIEDQKNFFLCILKNTKFKLNMIIICLEIIYIFNRKSLKKDFIFIKKFLKKIKNLICILKIKTQKIDYLKNNYQIMIIGRRNVGKSTLFNKICLQYDSIVTNIPGTTKNNITKQIYFSSKKVNLKDTAGLILRSKNLIEKIGILKNINKIFKSSLVLYVVDKFNLKNLFFNAPLNILEKIKNNKIIVLINKCDIIGVNEGVFKINDLIIVFLSARKSYIINIIKCFISKIVDNEKILAEGKHCFSNISELLNNCEEFYRKFCCSYDIINEKIINFQKNMFKITGEYTNINLLNSLFRNFCIGK
ncbi:50S ribosome-binding GTPase [Candidatus Carsonella ruddii]|uniref:50S ribosome-binding GTPase n=2 Tax=cellular organisms TaxID=131567 RepID=A0AAJ6JYE4_CARRU|nr:GTPase [Candidatus Carsonella ruddii]WGS67250.1 50S ribosome-binding GTPase [Candidatus Carsonella ruddii]